VDAGGKVKVGVTAPSHVHILRGELAGTDKQPEPAQPAA
jgi:sRNA-binding carbon storage regulator CsrA